MSKDCTPSSSLAPIQSHQATIPTPISQSFYVKREYEPFLTPNPCRIVTTAKVAAVGLSPLL